MVFTMNLINRTVRLHSTSLRPQTTNISRTSVSKTTEATNSFRVACVRHEYDAHEESISEPYEYFGFQEGLCGEQDPLPVNKGTEESIPDQSRTLDLSPLSQIFGKYVELLNVFTETSKLTDAGEIFVETKQRIVDMEATYQAIISGLILVKEDCEHSTPVNEQMVDWINTRISDINKLLKNNLDILWDRRSESYMIWSEETKEKEKTDSGYADVTPIPQLNGQQTVSNVNSEREYRLSTSRYQS